MSTSTNTPEREARKNRRLITSRKVVVALRENGHNPRSYSGRGMYGVECVAVSRNGDGEPLDAVGAFHIGRDTAEVDGLEEPRHDTCGRGIVIYWPDLPWPDDEDSDDEGDDE